MIHEPNEDNGGSKPPPPSLTTVNTHTLQEQQQPNHRLRANDDTGSRLLKLLRPSPPTASDGGGFLPQARNLLPRYNRVGPTVATTAKDGGRAFLLDLGSPSFQVGMEVTLVVQTNEEGGYYEDDDDEDGDTESFEGTLVGVSNNEDGGCSYEIALKEEGVVELELVSAREVSRRFIRPREPIVSGARVSAMAADEGGYFDGTILLVLADGSIDVLFDDGDLAVGVPFSEYEVLETEA